VASSGFFPEFRPKAPRQGKSNPLCFRVRIQPNIEILVARLNPCRNHRRTSGQNGTPFSARNSMASSTSIFLWPSTLLASLRSARLSPSHLPTFADSRSRAYCYSGSAWRTTFSRGAFDRGSTVTSTFVSRARHPAGTVSFPRNSSLPCILFQKTSSRICPTNFATSGSLLALGPAMFNVWISLSATKSASFFPGSFTPG